MHQFFHMSLYGRSPQKGGKVHETIEGIAAEAARLPGSCPHVKHPQPPTLIFGVSPLAAAQAADDRAQRARDTKGRRLRKNGAALAACVASYPLQTVKIKADPGAMATYHAWQADVLSWLQVEFGDTLMSVVAHLDEEYPHLHAYVVPALGPDSRLRWEDAHPGRRARAEAAALGASSKAVNAAYVAEMQALQDRFHAAVGLKYDHLRYGPRRRRVERAVALVNAKARKAEEERETQARAKLQETETKLREEHARRVGALKQKAVAVIDKIQEEARVERDISLAKNAWLEAKLAEQEAELARLREIMKENGLDTDAPAFSV